MKKAMKKPTKLKIARVETAKTKATGNIRWSVFILAMLSIVCFTVGSTAFAADVSLGTAALQITGSLSALASLITAGSYVAGFGFAVGAILKFKAHKDNPTQIPVGTPIALLFIAVALIFLPAIFSVTEQTIFGGTAEVGGVTGTTSFGDGGGGT